MGRGSRRADDGSASWRGHDHAAHPPAHRRGRRPRPGADRQVHRRQRRGRAGVRAGIRLRPGRWPIGRCRRIATAPTRPAPVRRCGCRPTCCSGSRPNHVRARHVLHEGEELFCALSWDDHAPVPTTVEEANAQLEATTRFWRHWLSRARIPDHEFRAADPALGARDQGADVHADGRDRRRADHVAARDPGRGAQLGLPLHVDPRLDVHAAGAALPRPRLGGRRVHAVHRRPRAKRRRRPADHVRDRRSSRPDRGAPEGSQWLRRRQPGAHRATARSTSARTTCSEPRWTRCCCTPAAASGCRGGCGR